MGAYCTLPKEAGNCLAYIPAWYYDHDTGTCKEFVYGGCGGNDNRFTTKDVCEASCSKDGEFICRPSSYTWRRGWEREGGWSVGETTTDLQPRMCVKLHAARTVSSLRGYCKGFVKLKLPEIKKNLFI